MIHQLVYFHLQLHMCIYIYIYIYIKFLYYNFWSLKFNLVTFVIRSLLFIICFNPIFCGKLRWSFFVLRNNFIIFWCSIIIYCYCYYYYYYINLRPSIVFCLCSGDIYLSLSISSSCGSELLFREVFETFVILSAILFPNKSPLLLLLFEFLQF